MVKISVIMSVYNGEKYLRDAIKSILSQTYNDFEFVIIDDASTDSSCEIIQSFNDLRIHLQLNFTNQGLTKSLNRGIFFSKGEYIARMDADDISMPERFKKQVAYLESHPDVSVLGTSSVAMDEHGNDIEIRWAAPNPMKSLKTGNHLTHGSVMFRKADVGYYDEKYFKYAQDYELWLHVARNHEIRNLDEPLYKMRLHKGAVGMTNAGEQALYAILARRLMGRRDVPANALYFEDLTKKERIDYYNMVIYNMIQGGDMNRAVQEMTELMLRVPLNLRNDLTLIVAMLRGRRGVLWLQNVYRSIRAIMQRTAT